MVSPQELLFTSMQSLSLVCISLFIIFIIHSTAKRKSFSTSPEKLIPSPPKLPFIGNLHQLSLLFHQSLYSLSLKYGPIMLLQFGEVSCLIVSSSDMACAVMRTHDLALASRPSFVATDMLRFGDIAFEPYGENWRKLKKIFTIHLMSAKKVHYYTTIREEEVGKLIAKISNHASLSSDNPIQLSKALFSFMMDVICRIVSGKFIIEEKKMYAMMQEVVEETFGLIGHFGIGDVFPSFSWLEGLIGLGRRAIRTKKKWNLFFEEVIQAHVERNKGEDNFVDILLSLKNDSSVNPDLTMNQMKGMLLNAFAAGIDTTYITIDWAMCELMKNPKIMKKLQEEVRGMVKKGDMVRSEDLNQMGYLRAVIKETLRLHPPIPVLPRESMEECEINGFTVPKGTKILVNVWAIGREAQSWEAPEEFMPERFISSQLDYYGNNFHFIPFGAGRRICPGIAFASATAELALANMIHHFDWELPNGMTREEFDMSDSPGFSVHRKDELELVVKKAYLGC
ncbi:Cytochrome P450 [Rhynchospora pubera]|uniref:Cytochrome P450 n=1 Tax=Rhynchospora pubera TaxID=906938 RepID=A0AAV8FMT3_9POAL|nr:Cytochrome P450 [Rhynchospora pubera]